MAVYYFDAHLNTSPGVPDDPNSAWTNDTFAVDGNITTEATSTLALGSTSSNYLKAKGTNAPLSNTAISYVRARGFQSQPQTATTVVITTAAGAETLGTILPTRNGGAFTVLTAPGAGWSWSTIQALEFIAYCNDGTTFFGRTTRIDVDVQLNHNAPGNYGHYVQVDDGMSRSEVAN